MKTTSKTLLVTGAASGMGRSIARLAHAEGMAVVAVDRNEEGLSALAAELPGLTCVTADVSIPDDVDRAVAAAGDRVDILVNNAGLMDRFLLVDELPEEEWHRVLDVNLTGPFLFCNRVVPGMVAQSGGVIVNISSVAGLRGGWAGVAYTSSKHGLVGLTKNIAHTFGRDGVRAVCVCPGGTAHGAAGAMEPGAIPSPRGRPRVVGDDYVSDPRLIGTPEGVASVVMFLASAGASRMNGSVVVVDDGATLR